MHCLNTPDCYKQTIRIRVKVMPNCPSCGAEINEEMAFCPKCGASLKVQQPADQSQPRRESRREWRERRRELREQRREARRYEKHEHGLVGPLIGGLVLVFLGLMFYYFTTSSYNVEVLLASFFVLIGLIVIGAALYGVIVAARRHPRT